MKNKETGNWVTICNDDNDSGVLLLQRQQQKQKLQQETETDELEQKPVERMYIQSKCEEAVDIQSQAVALEVTDHFCTADCC